MNKTTNKSLAAVVAGYCALTVCADAQSVYSADWSTLAGANGSYSVQLDHTSGAILGGVSSYTLKINNSNGRNYFQNGGDVLTSGPYTADVAQETNGFSVAGALFSGIATIQTSDITGFTNLTGIKGQLLNPTGTSTSAYPIDLGESDSTNLQWTSKNFGFDTLRTDPDTTNIWDEYGFTVSQTWTPVPEPSSTALLGLGALALLLRRKK